MSVIATAVAVTALGAASSKNASMGPAVWMTIMMVAMFFWVGYLSSEKAGSSESALNNSAVVMIVFGFVSLVAVMIFVP